MMNAEEGAATLQMVLELRNGIPENFDLGHLANKFPTNYENSMNMLLKMETARYNALLDIVRRSLHSIEQVMERDFVGCPALQK